MEEYKHEKYLIIVALVLVAAIVLYISISTPTLSAVNVVYSSSSSKTTISASSTTNKNVSKININTATADELESLPSIGTSIAKRIIKYRTQNGKFTDINEMKEVSGIGEAKFKIIAPLITLS